LALLGTSQIKVTHKMLVKLTPGVNFTNILCSSFIYADSKSAKNIVKSFALLGSVQAKAACKMLVKLTPGGGKSLR